MRSKTPLIVIETFEEPRAVELILKAGVKQQKAVYGWSVTEGLRRLDLVDEAAIPRTDAPLAVLQHIKTATSPAVYVLCDFHPYIEDEPKNVRLIKEIAMAHEQTQHTVILLSHHLTMPPELRRYCAQMSLSLPTDEQLLQLVKEEAAAWSNQNRGLKVKTDSRTLDKLVANLRGLSHSDARRLARGVIFDDGAITSCDIPTLNRAKFELLGKENVLSFEYDTATFAEVGGLQRLKNWLSDRREGFLGGSGDENGGVLDKPKGILLLGVQGGGKSLAAKAVAGLWGVPLLRMDLGALYNKFIGETERNLRESLALADRLAPCILWLDEIEKGLSSSDSDNGTSKRLLGTLLTWMAERQQPVFLVATSNDISGLPPELVRKGRLDEIFFVDLPDFAVRRDIFTIHLSKRQQPTSSINLDLLASASEGHSGAEIEQAVVSGLYGCQAEGVPLDTQHILQALDSTNPLSVVMAERLAALRAWAGERAVPAN